MIKNLHPIPGRDPVSGGELHISELASDETGISIRGRFEIPRYARLDADQAQFLETFLRCRGTLSAVERELGISYPTVRARLDALLTTLGLSPVSGTEEPPKVAAPPKPDPAETERKRRILEQLEAGEITADEAKQHLRSSE